MACELKLEIERLPAVWIDYSSAELLLSLEIEAYFAVHSFLHIIDPILEKIALPFWVFQVCQRNEKLAPCYWI